MPVFDFHVHPALKAQMGNPASLPTPWDIVKVKFAHPNLITTVLKCQGINKVIDSQASLSQLIKGNVNLIGLVLHPVESNMMQARLIRTIAEDEQTNYINLARVRDISTGEFYFIDLNNELKNLRSNLSSNGRRLKIIDNISQYKATDLNTVHAVLIVEGPHAFFGIKQGKTPEQIWQEFWNNFEIFTAANRILSMNIAHLQDNDFCNHAFGIQIFDERPFYPSKKGISEDGFKLLQRLEQKKIMVDVKHMSLHSRRQLYKYRMDEDYLPMVCTHAGLTGISREVRRKYVVEESNLDGGFLKIRNLKPYGYLNGTAFNACSINLYDEDVIEVIDSGGIIGLSMDQRILGVAADEMLTPGYIGDIYDEEVLSPGEKEEYFKEHTGYATDSEILKTMDLINDDDLRDFPAYHAKHFMNQVFHFFFLANKFGTSFEEMSQKICIGSDFDGFIHPVDTCPNTTKFESFRDYLIANFKELEFEFSQITKIKISDKIAPRTLMNNIFYNNAVAFLRQNFT